MGGCNDLIEFHEKNGQWICIQPEYKSSNPHDRSNKLLYGKWPDGSDGGEGKDSSKILDMMAEYDKKDFLMCCGSHAGSDTDKNAFGVVQGHAYTILSVVQNVAGSQKDMLQLRNPWGSGEWKGDWSDKSDMWSKHPDIKQALDPEFAEDGTFWIEAHDFFRNYSSVMVCCKDMGKNRVKKEKQSQKEDAVSQVEKPKKKKDGFKKPTSLSDATAEIHAEMLELKRLLENLESNWLQIRNVVAETRQIVKTSVVVSQG